MQTNNGQKFVTPSVLAQNGQEIRKERKPRQATSRATRRTTKRILTKMRTAVDALSVFLFWEQPGVHIPPLKEHPSIHFPPHSQSGESRGLKKSEETRVQNNLSADTTSFRQGAHLLPLLLVSVGITPTQPPERHPSRSIACTSWLRSLPVSQQRTHGFKQGPPQLPTSASKASLRERVYQVKSGVPCTKGGLQMSAHWDPIAKVIKSWVQSLMTWTGWGAPWALYTQVPKAGPK